MPIAVVYSRALAGMDAPLVTVEVHLANGLPNFTIVGLPETEVRESRDRVRAAIQTGQFEFPRRRITVNLAPADLPKEGARFDLPIALGILAASGQVPARALADYEFMGELALTGELRAVPGALASAYVAHRSGRALIYPAQCAWEGALVEGARVHGAHSLLHVCAHLSGVQSLPLATPAPRTADTVYPDMADVKGQAFAKRALEIAAAGGHSLLMSGPPGTGKSMLAMRLPGILPPMTQDEALACAAVQSLGNEGFKLENWRRRPFRAPHHTASAVALVGGGSHPKPGEISLATHGVLFLDELPEFERHVLEVLREPLESGRVTISRARAQVEFPAQFQLIAAMNPCPCGYLGHPSGRCHCSRDQVLRYRRRISGPLLDRVDLHIEVATLQPDELAARATGDSTEQVRQRVVAARARQTARQGKPNALLTTKEVEQHANVTPACAGLLTQAINRLSLSARAYYRILKVARTIADLADEACIEPTRLAEAIQYRRFSTPEQV